MRPTPCQKWEEEDPGKMEIDLSNCSIDQGIHIHVRYDAAASISGTATDAYVFTTALCGAGELVVA